MAWFTSISVYKFNLSIDNIRLEFNGLNGLHSSKNLTYTSLSTLLKKKKKNII